MRLALLTFCLFATLPLSAQKKGKGPWQMQDSHTTAGLRGIHNVGAGVAWASGTDGTVLRTEDGGYLWQTCAVPPGAAKLDFRGIWAWDAQTAVVMSSGLGDLSRVYKTTDGCSHWTLLYTNPDAKGFWDGIAFRDSKRGFLLGDPVDGRFAIFSTIDGGTTWYHSHNEEPAALPGEGAFAASNSSLAIGEDYSSSTSIRLFLRFGSGGAQSAEMHTTTACLAAETGCSSGWASIGLPLASGNASAGVFSLAFRRHKALRSGLGALEPASGESYEHGVAVGGDYSKPSQSAGTAAWTADGGRIWTAATKPPRGYRSAVEWDGEKRAWIAAGTNGSDASYDEGQTWQPLDDGNWNALSLPWVVGPKGRIAKLVSLKHKDTASKAAKSKATVAP